MTEPQKAFVNALINQEYPMGKDQLESSVGFCCLGVACKVAETLGTNVVKRDNGRLIGSYLEHQPEVVSLFGFINEYGEHKGEILLRGNQQCFSLAKMNDSGKTHKEIGEIILANPENYFVKV